MSKHFEQIIEEENLSELFTKNDTLNEELAKYVFNNCFIVFYIMDTVWIIIN